jgi:hypothetical protein
MLSSFVGKWEIRGQESPMSTLLAWLPFVGDAAVVVNGFARHREPLPKDS